MDREKGLDLEKGVDSEKGLVREKGLDIFWILRHDRRKVRIIRKNWI